MVDPPPLPAPVSDKKQVMQVTINSKGVHVVEENDFFSNNKGKFSW